MQSLMIFCALGHRISSEEEEEKEEEVFMKARCVNLLY